MSAQESESILKAELDQTYFADYLTALNALVDEAGIELTEDDMTTCARDPANVAMVEATIDADAFTQLDNPDAQFGITTRKLHSLVEDANASTVGFAYDQDTQKLDLEIGNYGYRHATIKPEHLREEPTLPDLDLTFKASFNSSFLKDAVQWFDQFTTHVKVGYSPEEGVFWMDANERKNGEVGTDDGCVELARDEIPHVSAYGAADSNFSLDYFKDILSAIPRDRMVTVEVGEEYPMRLSYDIAWEHLGPSDAIAHGEVEFMQAPRIAN